MAQSTIAPAPQKHESESLTEADIEAIQQDPEVQQAFRQYSIELQQGFGKFLTELASEPEWLSIMRGEKEIPEAEMQERQQSIGKAISGFLMEKGAQALQEFQETRQQILAGREITELSKKEQMTLAKQELLYASKSNLMRQLAAQGIRLFQQVQAQVLAQAEAGAGEDAEAAGVGSNAELEAWQKTTEQLGQLEARLPELEIGKAGLEKILERGKQEHPQIKLPAVDNLLAFTADLSKRRPRYEPMLRDVIEIARGLPQIDVKSKAQMEVAGLISQVKFHAAEAVMVLADEKERSQLLKDWLNDDNVLNKLAVVKLFTFSQGPNPAISTEAFRMLFRDPELRAAIEPLRTVPEPHLQDMLSLLDGQYESFALKQQRAEQTRSSGRRRFMMPQS